MRFQDYLRQDRSLAEATVINYTPIVRSFLTDRFQAGRLHWQKVGATDIAAFVRRQAAVVTSKRATVVVSALRCFLHYLFHRGVIKADLAACVPTIATWSLSNVPKCLPGEQIQKVLDSCDRKVAIGRRDYALLLLLARLGFRAGEVVALTLDDIDWDASLITVKGKGKRVVQMPLPSEVGAAIADYLSTARPLCASRRVFIRATAPLRGFANSSTISSLVDKALERAGVESKFRGSHLFRHSLASQMLEHEASLPEIGDVLRHRNPDTTAFTPKWIWSRFVQSHFPGREATNDAAASSHRRVRGTPARSGVQGTPHGGKPPEVRHVYGTEIRALHYDGTGSEMGDPACRS